MEPCGRLFRPIRAFLGGLYRLQAISEAHGRLELDCFCLRCCVLVVGRTLLQILYICWLFIWKLLQQPLRVIRKRIRRVYFNYWFFCFVLINFNLLPYSYNVYLEIFSWNELNSLRGSSPYFHCFKYITVRIMSLFRSFWWGPVRNKAINSNCQSQACSYSFRGESDSPYFEVSGSMAATWNGEGSRWLGAVSGTDRSAYIGLNHSDQYLLCSVLFNCVLLFTFCIKVSCLEEW